MAWSGGAFTRANGANEWVTDYNNGVGIEPARHDAQDNDLATGINQCLNKDGSNAATGNLNLGGNIPTNIGAGTAAAPAICAGGDVNTGIFSPSADNWAVATNGTERIRVDSTGKVGIGTTPTDYLSILAPASTIAGISLRADNVATAGELFVGQSSTTAFVQNRANGPLVFGTNNTERLRVAANGMIGIGNITPAVLIDTQRDANDSLTRFRIYNASSGTSAQTQIDVGNNANQSAVSMFLNSSANTANAGANAFHIFNGLSAPIRMRAGTSGGVDLASGATSWAAVSDIRLKKNVLPLTYGLNEVIQLEPVRFDYKDDESEDSKRIGFIAQQVKPVIPEAVTGSENTVFGVSAAELIPVLVNAIKQLEARIAAIES